MHHNRSLPVLAALVAGVLAALALLPPVPGRAEEPAALLHYKSRLGLMPPAYGLDPAAPAALAAEGVPTVPFLSPATSSAVGSETQVLAAADLTSDGFTDAAVATGGTFDPDNDQQLHLFVHGSGMLTRTQRLAARPDPAAIAAADFNSDGNNDVVLALAGDNALALYTQRANHTLNAADILPSEGSPDALAAGDFTGDRRADVAVTVPQQSLIRLWSSDSGGLTALPFTLPYQTGGFDALATGDLDNDGDDDVVALRGAGYTSDSVVVFLQDGGFFPISYTLSPAVGGFLPHSLAVGDVNDDGRDDVLVTAGGNAPDAYLNIFLQGNNGLATTPITATAHHLPSAVAVGDIDHNGRNDVVIAHDSWRTLSVYTQTTSGTLSPYEVASIPYSDRYRPHALALADMDGSGSLDIALVDPINGLTVLTNTMVVTASTTIDQPTEASEHTPGSLTVRGEVISGTAAVEVRLRGETDWIPATLNGLTWQSTLTLPNAERAWWVESRAISAGGAVQSPPVRRRIGVETDEVVGRLLVNDGAYATNQREVTLTLPSADVSGIEAMRLSEMLSTTDSVNEQDTTTDWLPYQISYPWTLNDGDGTKTIAVELRDKDQNVSEPSVATIILDTQVPSSTLTSLNATDRLVHLTWEGSDGDSGIATYDLQISDVLSGSTALTTTASAWTRLLWETTNTETDFTVEDYGTYCFLIRATDRAGNVESWKPEDGSVCLSVYQPVYLPIVLQ